MYIMRNIIRNLIDIIKNPDFYIVIIIILSFIIICNIFKKSLHGKLKTTLFIFCGIEVDAWALSHVLLYTYFGYMFPDYFVEFLILGILWELTEITLCNETLEKIVGCVGKKNSFCNGLRIFNSCDYWYGKIEDIPINMIGFLIGAYFSTS